MSAELLSTLLVELLVELLSDPFFCFDDASSPHPTRLRSAKTLTRFIVHLFIIFPFNSVKIDRFSLL